MKKYFVPKALLEYLGTIHPDCMKLFTTIQKTNLKARKINKIGMVLFIFLGMFIHFSCNNDRVYEKNINITYNKWHKDSIKVFQPKISDSLSRYNIYLNLRNTTDYSFRNIFLFLSTTYPNGKTERDTLEILLAKKDGAWLGSGYGNLRDSKIRLQQGVRIPCKGTFTFSIQQAMRQKELKGIADIGLRIDKQQ